MISPVCYKCKEELEEPGAILLSAPDSEEDPMEILKYHLCRDCFADVMQFICEEKI